jgi:trimethylamine--corrinoid protein Co-methyltransferase
MTAKPEQVPESIAAKRPILELLSQELLERIVAEAIDVLGKVGVLVEDEEALAVLGDGGAAVDRKARRAFVPEDLVWRCVRSAPSAISVFSRDGEPALRLEGWNVHFDPGSAAIKILDPETLEARPAVSADLVDLVRVTDALPNLAAQSTALVVSDVPHEIADRHRLFLVLLNSSKPVVTGTFTVEGFAVMKEMLAAVAGGEQALRQKPPAIFDACPSPPLKWSRLTVQSLLECARSGLPAELISMPLFGATAPVTLAGALVQHTAENLSGVVIHQLAGPGSPIIYGGSPAVFDMRHGTTAMGAMETAMVVCAYAQIGRFLGLPTHGYLGQSDAKVVDFQAGLESSLGVTLAALAGVNVVSGAGMLEFESCQSLEKLVIDDEICGQALRLARGIQGRGLPLAEDLWGDLGQGDHFLTSPTTLRWLREELVFPGAVIDRQSRDRWRADGATTALARARQRVRELRAWHKPKPLADDVRRRLVEIMSADARRHGADQLPGVQAREGGPE